LCALRALFWSFEGMTLNTQGPADGDQPPKMVSISILQQRGFVYIFS
jgi:hypothetical protein